MEAASLFSTAGSAGPGSTPTPGLPSPYLLAAAAQAAAAANQQVGGLISQMFVKLHKFLFYKYMISQSLI